MSYEAKLQKMGYTLEAVNLDTGRFLLAKRTGNLVYTSGCVSSWGGKEIKGKIGGDLSVEEGYEAAKFSALNCLQATKTLISNLDNVIQVVKVFGMVNVAPNFDDTPSVIHGCSDLLKDVFGASGQHARSAIGLTVPHNWAVEIEIIFEVKG